MNASSFHEPLGQYLKGLGLARGPIELSQLTGGQSNPTYKISVGNVHYVLRKNRPGFYCHQHMRLIESIAS
jgi:acyl-CoA dehydrogenase